MDSESEKSGARKPLVYEWIGTMVEKARPARWAVQNFAVEGGVLILAGLPKKARKGILALDLVRAVATGRPWLGRETFIRPVIYCAIEGGGRRMRRRVKESGQEPEDERYTPITPVRFLYGYDAYSAQLEAFEEDAKAGRSAPILWVIDTLAQTAAAEGWDESDNAAATRFIGRLERLAEATDLAIVVIHHVSPRSDRGQMRGASALEATAAAWCIVTPLDGEGLLRLDWTGWDGPDLTIGARVSRPNGIFEVRPVEADLLPPPRRPSGARAPRVDPLLADLRRVFMGAFPTPITEREIERQTGRSRRANRARLEVLLAAGEIRQTDEGWALTTPPPPPPRIVPGEVVL